MIVDTHLHLIDRSALTYPWLASVEPLNRDFVYETYALEAQRAGIDAVLHMEVDVEPSQQEAETAFVERLSRQPGNLIRGAIAACRPERDDFAGYLERQRANPFVKGFRRVLHVMPDDLSETPLFRENIQRLAGTGLPFDLCVLPRQTAKAIALADIAPDVQFVLDHCGVPDIKGDGFAAWKDGVADIARRPNVAVKISGVAAYADADWAIDALRPYVEHSIESFGWDRVVWGSDWPVCTLGGGLLAWVAATHALLEGASNSERSRLLSENARRIWSIG